jgi:hypothetical protein
VVDFSGRAVPPLGFVLQPTYTPAGIVERLDDGVTASHSPWYTEYAFQLDGVDAVAVLYLLGRDDESALLMACLGEAPEHFFGFLSGADFGDELTRLTAQHWPDVDQMLRRSTALATEGRILCNVATPGRVQWAVADNVRGRQLEHITHDELVDLLQASLHTYTRLADFGTQLPGVIHVLGGPDRVTRRLNLAAGLLGAGADIGKVLQGGVRADELLELAKAAGDVARTLLRRD